MTQPINAVPAEVQVALDWLDKTAERTSIASIRSAIVLARAHLRAALATPPSATEPAGRLREALDVYKRREAKHHRLLQTSARNCSICWESRDELRAALDATTQPSQEPADA